MYNESDIATINVDDIKNAIKAIINCVHTVALKAVVFIKNEPLVCIVPCTCTGGVVVLFVSLLLLKYRDAPW